MVCARLQDFSKKFFKKFQKTIDKTKEANYNVSAMCKIAHDNTKGDTDMGREYYEIRQKIRGKYRRMGDFAKDLGMTQGTLSAKLMGKREWTRAEIEKLAQLLELTPTDIMKHFF